MSRRDPSPPAVPVASHSVRRAKSRSLPRGSAFDCNSAFSLVSRHTCASTKTNLTGSAKLPPLKSSKKRIPADLSRAVGYLSERRDLPEGLAGARESLPGPTRPGTAIGVSNLSICLFKSRRAPQQQIHDDREELPRVVLRILRGEDAKTRRDVLGEKIGTTSRLTRSEDTCTRSHSRANVAWTFRGTPR